MLHTFIPHACNTADASWAALHMTCKGKDIHFVTWVLAIMRSGVFVRLVWSQALQHHWGMASLATWLPCCHRGGPSLLAALQDGAADGAVDACGHCGDSIGALASAACMYCDRQCHTGVCGFECKTTDDASLAVMHLHERQQKVCSMLALRQHRTSTQACKAVLQQPTSAYSSLPALCASPPALEFASKDQAMCVSGTALSAAHWVCVQMPMLPKLCPPSGNRCAHCRQPLGVQMRGRCTGCGGLTHSSSHCTNRCRRVQVWCDELCGLRQS